MFRELKFIPSSYLKYINQHVLLCKGISTERNVKEVQEHVPEAVVSRPSHRLQGRGRCLFTPAPPPGVRPVGCTTCSTPPHSLGEMPHHPFLFNLTLPNIINSSVTKVLSALYLFTAKPQSWLKREEMFIQIFINIKNIAIQTNYSHTKTGL